MARFSVGFRRYIPCELEATEFCYCYSYPLYIERGVNNMTNAL